MANASSKSGACNIGKHRISPADSLASSFALSPPYPLSLEMIDFKLLNSALYSFLLGSAFGSSLWGQTGVPFPGRIVQEQPIPSQVIQGQPFQGQIIQGQLIPGQIIQGQPIPGQIIQGPIFQGPITQGPIIQSPITQGPTTTQPASNTKAIAAARAKIAELNKRINALTTENSKLTSVTDLNNQLKNANTKLKEQTDQLSRKVFELEKTPKACLMTKIGIGLRKRRSTS